MAGGSAVPSVRVGGVGGGTPGADAPRSALGLGAPVTLLYRRTRAEMPAMPEEVDDARAEGVEIRYLTSPVAVLGGGGKVNALLDGRVSVSYEDIDDAVIPALRHRLLRNFQAEAENVGTESILEQVMKRVKRPRA